MSQRVDAVWEEIMNETNNEKEAFRRRAQKILEKSTAKKNSKKTHSRNSKTCLQKEKACTKINSTRDNASGDRQESSDSSNGCTGEKSLIAQNTAGMQRAIIGLGDTDGQVRKHAALMMHATICEGNLALRLPDEVVSDLFQSQLARALFQRFCDPLEQVRECAFKLALKGFQVTEDVVPLLPYFFPALAARAPESKYDYELEIFVHDIELHEQFKRGKAIQRTDKVDPSRFVFVEPSEEVRLLALRCLKGLFQSCLTRGSQAVLRPYFEEAVVFVLAHLRDTFPDAKIEACSFLKFLSMEPAYQQGIKHFAVGASRALFPVLRHRHARVRQIGVETLGAVVACPKPEKQKGAGTDAIPELVGYREENVIPIASFYDGEVNINYLAEVAQDRNPIVREKVAQVISNWLVNLPDRRDWESRLTPYLLNFLTDENPMISELALNTLYQCGKDYEQEHHKDIIDKVQYGVDGDDRMNHNKKLPPPFKERPKLGTRLFVRANARRFVKPLLEELTSWISKIRVQSGFLLRTLLVFMEDQLTMEINYFLPSLFKAVQVANSTSDREEAPVKGLLMECAELTGRFLLPDSYVPVTLLRAMGDQTVHSSGASGPSRIAALQCLAAMIQGSLPSQVLPHLETIVSSLTDEDFLDGEVITVKEAILDVLDSLIQSLKGRGKAAVEAHFLATGRLKSIEDIFSSMVRFLLVCSDYAQLKLKADSALQLTAEIVTSSDVNALLLLYFPILEQYICDCYCIGSHWSQELPPHQLLVQICRRKLVLYTQKQSLPLLCSLLKQLLDNSEVFAAQKEPLLVELSTHCFAELLSNDKHPLLLLSCQEYVLFCWEFLLHSAWAFSQETSQRRMCLLHKFINDELSGTKLRSKSNLRLVEYLNEIVAVIEVQLKLTQSSCDVKLLALEVGTIILDQLVGAQRLRPYSKKKTNNETWYPPVSFFVTILQQLDHSRHQICLKGAEVIPYLLHYLAPDNHSESSKREVHRSTEAVLGGEKFAYSSMLDGLLTRAAAIRCSGSEAENDETTPSGKLYVQLEHNLRLAAVLDPRSFRSAVEAHNSLAPCNMFEDLLDHADLLISFEK